MRLHTTVVEKLVTLVEMYSGHENEKKLRDALRRLDLTPYEQKTTPNQEVILVLTEDFLKQLQPRP